MILDSTNCATYYIQDKPDWGAAYSFDLEAMTQITKSKDGSEQRARKRNRVRYSLSYQIAAMNLAELTVRKAAVHRGLGGLLAVPIWHAVELLVSSASNAFTLTTGVGLVLAESFFRVGGLAYFEQTGKTSVFRRVDSFTGDNVLNLVAGNAEFPDIAMPAFTAGAKVYPVVIGIADENSTRFVPIDAFTTTQLFDVMQL